MGACADAYVAATFSAAGGRALRWPVWDHTYIARTDDGRAYLVKPVNGGQSTRAIHIDTNGLFDCLVT